MRYWLLNTALLALVVASGVGWGADPSNRTIRVSGEGNASAPPHLATVNTSVSAEDPDVGKALARSTAKMTRVQRAARNAGVAPENMQTTGFTVDRVTKDTRNGGTRFVGYRVRQGLRVRVRNMRRVGALLSGMVQAGTDRVGHVGFSVRDPGQLANEARRRAVENAVHRAHLYARTAGTRVGRVLSITEGRYEPPAYGNYGGTSPTVPVSPGRVTARATVNITFAVNNRR